MYKKLTWAERRSFVSKYNSSVGFEKISEALAAADARVHFVGVGGVGMYSLFLLTAARGIRTSGSDAKPSERTKRLIDEGFDVKIGHSAVWAENSALIVYSLAASEYNPELLYAAECGILTVSRAEYLAYLMKDYKTRISVSGSHGKSTVTAMTAASLSSLGFSPTVVSGAELPLENEPFKIGEKDFFVFEACEYKDSFLSFAPELSVYTNLELDHTDYFESLDDIKRSFEASVKRAKCAVINIDDENLRELIPNAECRVITYGMDSCADFRAVNISGNGGKYSFGIEHRGKIIAEPRLDVYGSFSVYNALAAFAAAYTFSPRPEIISASLSNFSGIERRFQKIAEHNGAPVIYDYAHHPTEIASVINAAKEAFGGAVTVVFKPHTYTRTRDLWDGFVSSLALADRVLLLEIDGIREREISGVSAKRLAAAVGASASAVAEEAALAELEKTSGTLIIMGAADTEYIKSAFGKNKAIDKCRQKE